MDALLLSRLQFAFTIMFHYLFPPLTIGLGWIMVIMEGMYLKTKDPRYEGVARFLTGIFAVVFAMGVATGIVMEFQFGTNWSEYSRYVGDIFGAALAAEGIFAFFLESGFLAVLVFGWDRVSPKMHFFATCMVALGAVFSSIWIVVANSWQQTPRGFHLVETAVGTRAELTSFWEAVINYSTVNRLVHVWIAAGILAAFFVLSVSAYYILKNRHLESAGILFKVSLIMALVLSVLMPVSGHFQARNVAKYQPAKLAAFEGLYETEESTRMYLLGWPNDEARRVDWGLAVPGMLSFLVHDNFKTPVPGLDQVPEADHPPVWLSFQSYHLMVALGMYFIGVTLLGICFWWRGTLFQTRWLLWVFVFSVVGPYIANQMGWVAAEVGRQPWVVYGLLRTSDGYSITVSAGQVLGSILGFGLIYFLLFAVWVYLMDAKIRKGPEPVAAGPGRVGGFFESAAQLASPAGPSMTSARDEERPEDTTEGR